MVLARVLAPLRAWSAPDGSDHQEYFSAEVLERIDGDPGGKQIDVFAHAEGEPRLRTGDHVVLFLDETAERAEFATLAVRFPHFTTQGAGQEWRFDPDDPTMPDLVRRWRALAGKNDEGARMRLLVEQLQDGNPRLASDAITELVGMRARSGFASDPEARATLVGMSRDQERKLQHRLVLIRLLDGSENYSAADELLKIAATDLQAPERVAVLRSSARIGDPRVTKWIGTQIDSSEDMVRIAALASAAGRPDLLLRIEATAAQAQRQIARAAVRALAADPSAESTAALGRIATGGGSAASLAEAEMRNRSPRP